MTTQHLPRTPKLPVPLPPGYGIAQFDDGRFYLLRIDRLPNGEVMRPHLLYWEGRHIPFAVGPRSTQGVISFASLALAVAYCERSVEDASLLRELDERARSAALYPERFQWYDEAIRDLLHAHDASPSSVSLYPTCGVVYASLYYRQRGHAHSMDVQVQVQVETIDEVRPALYEALLAHLSQNSSDELELHIS